MKQKNKWIVTPPWFLFLFNLAMLKGLLTPNQNGRPTGMAWPSCGPDAALLFSLYIVLGSISKSSCCAVYLTGVKVVIVWALLALKPPLMIGLYFRPAAFSTPQDLTSVKTRQSTTCKYSPGLEPCIKERASRDSATMFAVFSLMGIGVCYLVIN